MRGDASGVQNEMNTSQIQLVDETERSPLKIKETSMGALFKNVGGMGIGDTISSLWGGSRRNSENILVTESTIARA